MGIHPLMIPQYGFRALTLSVKRQAMNFSTSASKFTDTKACKSGEDVVLVETFSGGKACFTLNRPKPLNAINHEMVVKMREALLRWDGQKEKHLIVLKGSGEKAFCAGGDIVTIAKDKSGETGKKFFTDEYKLDAMISSLKAPFVSLISGIIMGGGVGVSIFGKYRIATETSMFAMPETQIGFFPDVGVSYHLARMPQHLGQFLGLTGYRLNGYDLVHAGIATHFCSKDKLAKLEDALLRDFSRSCTSTPADIIQEFHANTLKGMKNESAPAFTLEPHLKTIETWFGEETLEAAMKKIAEDKTKFGTDTKELLSKMSPLSLRVTFQQIKEAANKDVFECFNTDYRIAMKMMETDDFFEGVRALLIDKDKKPKWKHMDVTKVTKEEVDAFFAPRSDDLNLPQTLKS